MSDRIIVSHGRWRAGALIKRSFAAGLIISFLSAVFYPALAGAIVADTKHNLGFYSPGMVKSPDTTEICIFCHTPHSANPEGPLWNRTNSGATYVVYATDTMVSNTGQPTGSSKLCLSCHDGTIALGSLLNLPGASTSGLLNVEGADAGKIGSASASHIGTDLSDDHPVSFSYSNAFPANAEIHDSSTLPPTVKLDSGVLQCTACHDPHGTDFDKFLVASLDSAGLCTTCHKKLYWYADTPVHSTSTAVWNNTGTNPWHEDLGATGYADDTPALQGCLSCHRSHGGAAGMALTKGVNPGLATEVGEEWTCLSCHNGTVATTDMTPYFNGMKFYQHPVMDSMKYDTHQPTRPVAGDPVREDTTTLDLTNRHVECADCHNPHGAKTGNHTVGGPNGNVAAPNLYGGWGVKPLTWPANLPGAIIDNTALNYTIVDFDTTTPVSDKLEGYMCMKCHSAYAYGTTIASTPEVPSGNADDSLGVIQSDISGDFNPNNASFHPVFAVGLNQPIAGANPNWGVGGTLTQTFRYVEFTGLEVDRSGFYNMTHTSKVTCSDCHGSNLPTDVKGPHGSDNKWILRGNETGVGTSVNFCYNCHRRDVYGDNGYIDAIGAFANPKKSRVNHPPGLSVTSPFYDSLGVYTGNNSNKFGNLCLTCHGGAWGGDDNGVTPDTSIYLKRLQLPGEEYKDRILGVHGSNIGDDPDLIGDENLSHRMMNGACVQSYTKPTTTSAGSIVFRAAVPGTDKMCNFNFGTVAIPTTEVNYDY